jgi:uncharacterized protein YukE
MPDWQPDWSDVRFDHAAAEAAAAECDRTAAVIGDQRACRAELARLAGARWRGRNRDDFDAAAARLDGDAAALAATLTSLAARIRQAADQARAEQARREAQRASWHREQAREAELAAR